MVNRLAVTLLALLTGMLLSLTAHAEPPSASVDRSELYMNETLTLVVSVQGQLLPAEPDLAPLRSNFDVLGSRQSSRHSIVNGRRESVTEWRVELAPRRVGVLTIPALEVADGRTEPLSVKVLPADARPARRDNRSVFTEAEVDHSRVYVQQQILLTVRIFQAVELDDMNITEPSFDHASLRKVSQTRYQRQIDATTYRVHELVYAIFPQQAGELTIPELVFSARQPTGRRSMFDLNPGIPVRDLTPQLSVTVEPPADTAYPWLPASQVELREQWRGDPQQLREGESVTRSVTLWVDGQPAAHLPELELIEPDGLRLYADQPQRSDTDSPDGVQGSLVQSAALVPTRAGEVTLPALRVHWWNTGRNRMEVAELPARTLEVAASSGMQQPTLPILDAPAAAASSDAITAVPLLWPWQLATAVLAIAWLGTVGLWWSDRSGLIGRPRSAAASGHRRRDSEAAAWKRLSRAAAAGDAIGARNALLEWAALRWPAQNFLRLEDIAHHFGDEALSVALDQLQQQLYGQAAGQTWNGRNLLERLKPLRGGRAQSAPDRQPLPPLNP